MGVQIKRAVANEIRSIVAVMCYSSGQPATLGSNSNRFTTDGYAVTKLIASLDDISTERLITHATPTRTHVSRTALQCHRDAQN
mmetsp:Transcript_21603/g.56421  ORF Transcript_21603/g.56421 Transcript_21603/m.56421 type:complete len:84 (-) Transcript_21603:5206-5457(-)